MRVMKRHRSLTGYALFKEIGNAFDSGKAENADALIASNLHALVEKQYLSYDRQADIYRYLA